MMQSIWTNETILIAGLGESGWAALRYLAPRAGEVRLADTRAHPPGVERLAAMAPLRACFGPFSPSILEGVTLVVKSPGLAPESAVCQQARAHGIPVVGDIEVFARELAARRSAAKVIAITGANGKSTVTELCGEMCRAAGLKTVVAGNIGLAVLDALDGQDADPDAYVLELSSFQLEDTASLRPDAAAMLNLSEDHMDRYAGLADYAAAKARIFAGDGVQVLNREDGWSMGMRLDGRALVTFGLDRPAPGQYGLVERNGEKWLAEGEDAILPLSALKISGLHNAANAMAALALCRAIGLPRAPLLDALRNFAGLPHRVQWVAEIQGVAFYDDSKGTNVGATQAALAGLGRRSVLIAGGDGKGQDFGPLRQTVAEHARVVVLIGRDANLIAAALAGSGVELLHCTTMGEAVGAAFAAAREGDAVLLSPACASWDMFRNYAHRAEAFVDAVRQLMTENA